MKKLGKIFKKYWQLILGAIAIVLLFVYKPWKWFGIDGKTWRSSNVSDNQLKDIAENVYNTMKLMGTREKKLFSLLEPLTGSELKSVYKYFGVRNYWLDGRAFGLGKGYDLFEWFNAELNKKEKAQMREIWAKSGMMITF